MVEQRLETNNPGWIPDYEDIPSGCLTGCNLKLQFSSSKLLNGLTYVRESLQETIDFSVKYVICPVFFRLNQSIDLPMRMIFSMAIWFILGGEA